MDATQEDLGNDDGASQAPDAVGRLRRVRRGSDANSGDGAEGSGIAGG